MAKERDYFVPSQTKLIEVAELFACEVSGEKSGPKFERVKKQFLDEAIQESVLPADSVYAQNPKISDSVMKEFPALFGAENIILKSLGDNDKSKRKTRELRGLITQLTHLFLESRMKLGVKGSYDGKGEYTPSDFEFASDSGDNEAMIKQVIIDRYIRLFIFTAFMQAIEPIFKITIDEMRLVLNGLKVDQDTVEKLKSKQMRVDFILKAKSFFGKIFGTESVLKKFLP